MKKLLLVAAIGVAGIMSAKSFIKEDKLVKSSNAKKVAKVEKKKSKKIKVACYTVTYVLSCQTVKDSYCTDWDPITCSPWVMYDIFEEELC